MPPAFDYFSQLDPAKLQRDIAEKYTDVALPASIACATEVMVERVNALHANTVSSFGELDPHLMCAELAGGGAYSAKAVHFDGSTWLSSSALSSSDSPYVWSSFWIKVPSLLTGSRSALIYNVDPQGDYSVYFELEGDPGVNGSVFCDKYNLATETCVVPHVSGAFWGTSSIPVFDPDGHGVAAGASVAPTINTWHHLFQLGDVETGLFRIYMDRVDVTQGEDSQGIPAVLGLHNKPLFIGTDLFNTLNADLADFALGTTKLWDNTGSVSSAMLDKFVTSGLKPVNPSGFPTTAVLLSGDMTAFLTNRGADTATFSVAHGTLTDASTSPSD